MSTSLMNRRNKIPLVKRAGTYPELTDPGNLRL